MDYEGEEYGERGGLDVKGRACLTGNYGDSFAKATPMKGAPNGNSYR